MDNVVKKSNSLKRQWIIVCFSVIAFVILLLLYLLVFKPMLDKTTYEEYQLFSGEALNINGCKVVSSEGDGKISLSDDKKMLYCSDGDATVKLNTTNATTVAGHYYMFPTIEASDVDSIDIENETESYGFYYDKKDDEYYIRDYKGTPYENTYYSQLSSATRNPYCLERLTDNIDDLSQYGFVKDDNHSPAKYTITSKNGDSYTVIVGDMIVTGGGYYCMVEGREDVVYIIDTSMGYLKFPVEKYVTPLLSFPVSNTEYYSTEVFTLKVDGEVFVSCGYMTEAERQKTASTSIYKMIIPDNYTPSSTNYGELLKTFVEFKGTEVLKFGKFGETMDKETLSEYKLDNPKYEIYYRYSSVDNYVYVSEQNEDGTYYAYSLLFNMVCRVDADMVKFLRWDFIDFIDKPLFQKNINDVASIRIEGADGTDVTFKITGDSNENLSVTPSTTNKTFDADYLENFRHLYVKMLQLSIEEYAPEVNTDEWAMRMTIVTDYDMTYTYDFYNYSTRRCFFTINGVGEFYCLRDRVEKILSDTNVLLEGGEIDGRVLS